MKRVSAVLGVAIVSAFVLAALAGVATAADGGTVVATGFNGPQGILVASDGSVWVIDSGVGGDQEKTIKSPETGQDVKVTIGDTARVVKIAPDGKQTVAATLPSVQAPQEASGGSRLALLGGVLYATSGGWTEASLGPTAPPNTAAVVKIEGGKATEVAQPWKLEQEKNPGGFAVDSHPYGLTAGPDGSLWVADAGGNDLLKVNPSTGQVDLVAVFPGIPGPMANPGRGGANESDPVPTAVAFGADGAVYVSLLPGAPFLPGSSKIVKVGADGSISDYATGLTMTTDLRPGPDGNLYAVQIGQFTDKGPVPNSGKIIRIKAGGTPEVVLSGLSFPTSIDFNAAGDAFVTTNGVGASGSGQVVKYAALTGAAGSALPPPTLPTTGAGAPEATLPLAGIVALGLALVAGGLVLRNRRVLAVVRRRS
jgi:LPXTG-motif cell wall-anchored protein